MTENANILTTPSVTLSRHQVIALAYDGLCTFEFGVAVEIFGLPRPEMGDNWYQFAVAAIDEGPLCATGGIRLMTDGGPELLAQADTDRGPRAGAASDAPVPEALCAALASA
ncbi:transcriptional regulator FtrA, partial [Klebsiella pneumoniae]